MSFSNLAGSEVAVLSCSEAAQDTFVVRQREIAERAEVELGRVQLVLAIGDVLSAKSATSVLFLRAEHTELLQSIRVCCGLRGIKHH